MKLKSSSQKCQVPLVSSLMYIFLFPSLRDVFIEDRQRGRMLGLILSISSPQGYYKKMSTSEPLFDEDLMK